MNRLLLPLVVAGGAAAQRITALPQLRNAVLGAAVNTNDPEYTLCTNANSYLEVCINSFGGTRALATAAPTGFLGCVCCIEGTAISEAYSTCSSYFSVEEPSLSSEYSAYDTLYSVCGMTSCAAGSSRPSATSRASSTREDDGDDETITSSIIPASETITIPSSITATASLDDFPLECSSMLGLYESCSREIDGFSAQPFRQQASCYCCQTSDRSLVWTDELDGYAQTCRDWARTGDPSTFFPLASTFATFCDRFSDVCQGPATASPTSSNVPSGEDDDDSNAAGGGGDRETVTVTQPAPEETDRPGAGSVVRAGCAAGLVAAVGAALLLA